MIVYGPMHTHGYYKGTEVILPSAPEKKYEANKKQREKKKKRKRKPGEKKMKRGQRNHRKRNP